MELAVAVDELRVGKEIHPVVHDFVEAAQQPLSFERIPLEQLRGLSATLVTEVFTQQVRHLPTMPHLLTHHAHDRLHVVVAGRLQQQVALLFHRGELGIALIDDQVHQSITDALIGNVHERWPLALTSVMSELDGRLLGVAKLDVEVEITEFLPVEADAVLPKEEVVSPVVPIMQFAHACGS